MTPIDKGSRFLTLSGPLRGQTATAMVHIGHCIWSLEYADGTRIQRSAEELGGPRYHRLLDAPTTPHDSILVELSTAAIALGDRGRDGPPSTLDEIWWVATLPETDENDDATRDDVYRAALVEVAALAIAGIHQIDRRTM